MRRASSGAVAWIVLTLCVVFSPLAAMAEDAGYKGPWERFGVQAGSFIAGLNDQVKVGTEGGGILIDLEEVLGLETQNVIVRGGILYRIGERRRHRVDLDYLYFNRSATQQIGQDIVVDNVTVPAGTVVSTTFNYQILRAAYSYSFFQDDRMDLAASFGMFVMPLKFEIAAEGVASGQADFDFTAPLPALGLRGDFAITPRWFLRTNLDFFYLSYQSFRGGLVDFRMAVEYNPWKHFGIGLGLDSFKIGLQAQNEDYPGIDFRGDVKSQFLGLQLYMRYFF